MTFFLMVVVQYYLMLSVLPNWELWWAGVLLIGAGFMNLKILPRMGSVLVNLLAVLSVGYGLYRLKSFWTVDTGDYFLLILSVIRLYHLETIWQKRVMVYSSLMLLMSYLILHQDFSALLLMIIDLVIILMALFSIESSGKIQMKVAWVYVLRALVYSLPFWFFLFIVFPRFNINFLGLKVTQAAVGFSEGFDPSQINEIVQSKELAFKAKLDPNQKASNADLYWRGLYYKDFEGFQWRLPVLPARKVPEKVSVTEDLLVKQKITLGTGAAPWVLSLGYPVHVKVLSLDHRERLSVLYVGNHIYKILSQNLAGLRYEVEALSKSRENEKLSEYLTVPEGLSAEVHDLAQRLGSGKATLDQKILSVMSYFIEEKFRYTLNPGNYKGVDGLSEFLLQRKLGFCEHFAAAFATLMRLMDVPSRVVVGYQGGSYNAVGDFWIVRQQEAHAWTEVYDVTQQAWRRVDPTVWVEPLRISLGGDYNHLSEEELAEKRQESHSSLKSFFQDYRLAVEKMWQSFEQAWDHFIMNYDKNYQMVLWIEFMNEIKNQRALSAIGGVLLIYVLYLFSKWWQRKLSSRDELREEFKKIENFAYKKLQIVRIQGESEQEFLEKMIDRNSGLEESVQLFWETYCECRYGGLKMEGSLRSSSNNLLRQINAQRSSALLS